MKVHVPKQVRLKGKDGAEVTVDLSNVKMTKAQQSALTKLLQTGENKDLTDAEHDSLKNLKAQVQGGDAAMMIIVRFDLRWFRITEPPRPR